MNKFLLATSTIISFIIIGSLTGTIIYAAQAQQDAAEWQLSIRGAVNNSKNFTLAELTSMPNTTVTATIYCVDFPTVVVTSGEWTGVKLSTLLERVGVLPSAVKVGFFASDGYSTDLDLEPATVQDIVVAYAKDSVPLEETLRLVAPGKWGYKWISQLTDIVLFDFDFKGKWENAGYSDEANVELGAIRPNSPSTYSFPNPSPTGEPAQSQAVPIPDDISPPSDSTNVEPAPEAQEMKPETQSLGEIQTVWIALAIASVAAIFSLILYIKKRSL